MVYLPIPTLLTTQHRCRSPCCMVPTARSAVVMISRRSGRTALLQWRHSLRLLEPARDQWDPAAWFYANQRLRRLRAMPSPVGSSSRYSAICAWLPEMQHLVRKHEGSGSELVRCIASNVLHCRCLLLYLRLFVVIPLVVLSRSLSIALLSCSVSRVSLHLSVSVAVCLSD